MLFLFCLEKGLRPLPSSKKMNVVASTYFKFLLFLQVSSDVVKGCINCLCNHLSAFGGDFFVPPNKIDFKTVFSKFQGIGKDNNFNVLTTVCTLLSLYIICLIFARQADKRDKQKVSGHVYC